MAKVQAVTDATFKDEVLSSDLPVLVDFWAPWCGPCRQMAPVVEQVADDLEGRVKAVKVDVDENAKTARSFGIQQIPTFAVVRDGEVIHQFSGSRPRASLKAEVEKVLG